jgi:hypothetical protein
MELGHFGRFHTVQRHQSVLPDLTIRLCQSGVMAKELEQKWIDP